ncbi:MAG: class I SAM-dependent methyltransferase [Bacteroidia bacterium]|nr:class I SAM-dependent methyltransferase [Bacteroidia bacterium]
MIKQILKYLKHYFAANKNGHGIHSPFVYSLVENVFSNNHAFYDFEELLKLRIELEKDNTILSINDLGAGSKTFTSTNRKVKDIAKRGISSKTQSEALFKLINYLNCTTIVELGTSIGLNTLYLSKSGKETKVYTIEGSEALCNYAKALFNKHKATNIISVLGNFDVKLPELFNEIKTFSLLYIDGNHTYEGTISYFNLALKHKTESSVIVFDDIYWSDEMEKAWREIQNNSEVTISIDCFYFGIVFFRKENKQKEHFRITL